jgi:hypothetical protein
VEEAQVTPTSDDGWFGTRTCHETPILVLVAVPLPTAAHVVV